MIISAQIIESDVLPQPLPAPSVPRGDPAYPMDPWDFIQYHRSGRRWLNAAPWELKDHVSNTEAIRLLALNTVSAGSHYAHRPATFPYTRLECPICCSISHSKVCRACGRSRVSKTDTRPWNGNMKYCATWAQQQDDANRRIISDDVWERGIAAAASLASDYAANELLTGSQCRNLLTGVWHDSATGLDIPLRTVLDCIPSATGAYSDYLCSLSLAEDSDPTVWNAPAFANSIHLIAALKQMLFNAATGETRHTHAWIVLEKHAPYLVSRRATSPDILTAGYNCISAIIARYAQSLTSGIWPAFDSDSHLPGEAFAPCTFEPSMAAEPPTGSPTYPCILPDAIES